ncbi:unnamed protein product, partial [Effrenium voratum]
ARAVVRLRLSGRHSIDLLSSMMSTSKFPSATMRALLLALVGPAAASPQDKPPAALQTRKELEKRGVSHGLTAVGLPAPWGASAPVSSVVQGHLAPTMHASGQASSSLWACIVAGAGAVGHNIRQNNREPRRRQPRRGSRQATVVDVEQQVESEAEVVANSGWQTASEDESEEPRHQIGRQQQVQFLQQVMGMQSFPQPEAPALPYQMYDQQFNQQMMYWQPMQQQSSMQQQPQSSMQQQSMRQPMQPMQQPMRQMQQMQPMNPGFQMQMPLGNQMQPMQSYMPMHNMVLVAVPVVPETEQSEHALPQDFERRSFGRVQPRAPSVSSTSEISTEFGSTVSTRTPGRERISRWTNKESEAIVRQLQAPNLDVAQRRRLVERVAADAWSMAITKQGTRVVQAALEVADLPEKLNMVAALKGRVWTALKSPHANHVLQKAISHLPPQKIEFIIQEMRGRVGDAARHPFGCRVLERLLEHCPREQTEPLAKEVLSDVLELCRHPYGNYVVQHTLEHGSDIQKQRLCEAMRPEVGRLARHKVASHVVECALLHSAPEERQLLKDAMASNAEESPHCEQLRQFCG